MYGSSQELREYDKTNVLKSTKLLHDDLSVSLSILP
jgi:hypothetical protein